MEKKKTGNTERGRIKKLLNTIPLDGTNDIFHTLSKVKAEKSLKSYVQQVWPIVEMKKPCVWNWHLDCICQHLEAVTNTYVKMAGLDGTKYDFDGYNYKADWSIPNINYLWFNMPPRHTKSLIVGVIWPTWEWGPQRLPFLRYIFTSYAQGLSIRDSLKRRKIIRSKWYRERWKHVCLTGDQNQKIRFENTEAGYMIATSLDGIATGEGGDRVICDDPHNVREVESEKKMKNVINTWDDAMSTRVDDDEVGAYIGVMQRVGPNDLTQHILEKKKLGEMDFAHVCLPARYEKDHPVPTDTPLGFKDPRTVEGEPLDKRRWPDKKLKLREGRMTQWAVTGQLQQRPIPKGGAIVMVERIKLVDNYNHSLVKRMVRYWDKAASTDLSASHTCGLLMAEMAPENTDYRFLILDCIAGQWGYAKRHDIMKQAGKLDGIYVTQVVEQEGGSGGKEAAIRDITETFVGSKAERDRPTGPKDIRLEPFATQVENFNVACLIADWTKDYKEALEKCVVGGVTDQGDATSGAFNYLNRFNVEKKKSKARVR